MVSWEWIEVSWSGGFGRVIGPSIVDLCCAEGPENVGKRRKMLRQFWRTRWKVQDERRCWR